MDNNLITVKEALSIAKKFGGVSRSTLYRWANKKIKVQQIGGQLKFNKNSLLSHLIGSSYDQNATTDATNRTDETIEDATNETSKTEEIKIEKEKPYLEGELKIDKSVLGLVRQEAFESGKKEGEMKLMEENKKIEIENINLKSDKKILEKDKEILNKDKEGLKKEKTTLAEKNAKLKKIVKSEKFQKIVAFLFLFFWIIGWLIYFIFTKA